MLVSMPGPAAMKVMKARKAMKRRGLTPHQKHLLLQFRDSLSDLAKEYRRHRKLITTSQKKQEQIIKSMSRVRYAIGKLRKGEYHRVRRQDEKRRKQYGLL